MGRGGRSVTSPAAERSETFRETFKLFRACWPRPPVSDSCRRRGSCAPGAAGMGILSRAGGRSAGALDALIGSSGGKPGLVRKLGGCGRGRERPDGE